MDCKVNKPYPLVRVEDYSGLYSELTSITQYVYQKFDKFNVNEIFSKTLSEIAMVEMHHLELLGETIKLLGVEPRYVFKDNFMTYWSGSFVDYNTNIIDMLLSDIKLEEEAINKYEYDISVIDDEYIKLTLYRIIEDEKMHIKCFNKLLNLVC